MANKDFSGLRSEILAPAGSFDCITAAVRCGADAVYLGSKSFSARANAQNFEDGELRDAVAYCHERDVRVHLALNTAIYDSELPMAAKLIEDAAKIGIDALIISDLGVLSLAREICPDMSLHASTQMGIASVSGARMAQNLGFSRAVLARELSKEEIAQISKSNIIETEVFVHGALCMCVSGQCYLSAVLGGRSGNRGRCAQPCRLDFGVEQKGGYALSLKDNSLCQHISELCKMNVTSLKIEGRMKRPEYVAAAVSLVKASMQGSNTEEIYALSKDIFSRSGFTDGYYKSDISKNMFGFRSREDVVKTQASLSSIHELYRKESQTVSLDAQIDIEKDKPVCLRLCDKNGNEAVVSGEIANESLNAANEGFVLKQLSRLGSTPYFIKKLKCNIDNGMGVSPSQLNALRREAVDILSKKRRNTITKQTFIPNELEAIKKEKTEQFFAARFENLEQFYQNYELCQKVFLPIRECLKLIDSGAVKNEVFQKIIAELDRWAFSNDGFTENAIEKLKQNGISRVCVQNIGQLFLAKQKGLKICFGAFMNIYNSRAVKLLSEQGIDMCIASFEVSSKKLSALKPFSEIGALVYGYLPLMMTRACPKKSKNGCKGCKGNFSLIDRTGKSFKVVCRGKVSEIYNSVALSAQLEKGEFNSLDFLLAYFTTESPKRCREVILSIKNGISPNCDDGFTRGLYKSGVI